MSLLDNARKEAQVTEAPATEGTPVAKKHSNSEYQKRQREHQYKAACAIRDFLKEKKIVLPEDLQAEMDFLTKEKKAAAGSAFGKPVLYKIFGNTPKKGDSVTALKVFEETGKGFAEMRSLMKKWAEKQNVTVKYDEAKKAYVVDSDVPAYTEA